MVIKGCAMAAPSPCILCWAVATLIPSLSLSSCALLVANCATVLVTIMADNLFTPLAARGVNSIKIMDRGSWSIRIQALRDY
ncbi:hypothetical protein CF119_07710 [Aeromonas sobria]|nr:hypothetical protein CF119_07710 [Aeromonas sobria]